MRYFVFVIILFILTCVNTSSGFGMGGGTSSMPGVKKGSSKKKYKEQCENDHKLKVIERKNFENKENFKPCVLRLWYTIDEYYWATNGCSDEEKLKSVVLNLNERDINMNGLIYTQFFTDPFEKAMKRENRDYWIINERKEFNKQIDKMHYILDHKHNRLFSSSRYGDKHNNLPYYCENLLTYYDNVAKEYYPYLGLGYLLGFDKVKPNQEFLNFIKNLENVCKKINIKSRKEPIENFWRYSL